MLLVIFVAVQNKGPFIFQRHSWMNFHEHPVIAWHRLWLLSLAASINALPSPRVLTKCHCDQQHPLHFVCRWTLNRPSVLFLLSLIKRSDVLMRFAHRAAGPGCLLAPGERRGHDVILGGRGRVRLGQPLGPAPVGRGGEGGERVHLLHRRLPGLRRAARRAHLLA